MKLRSRIYTNPNGFLKLVDSLDLDGCKIGKEMAPAFIYFPFTIKLAIGLNVFQQDPSPHGRILLLVSLLNSFHREGLQNSIRYLNGSYNIMGISLKKHRLVSKDSYSKSPSHALIFGSKSKLFMTMSILVTRRTIDQSAGGKLRDRNAKESWALLKDLALHNNESCNDPRDFAKPVKAISFPQDVPSTSDRRVIKLENQVQCLMEAHIAPMQPTQVNKIISSCEICSGPHDTQYCMENPEQAFVEYAFSRTDEATGLVSNFMASQDARLPKFEAYFKQQQSKMTNKIDTVLKAITDQMARAILNDMVKNPKLNIDPTSLILSARSYPTEDPQCSTHIHGSINTITIHPKQ
ncbi:hypothetical protein Tco_0466536 [Tanacetum coccineum]